MPRMRSKTYPLVDRLLSTQPSSSAAYPVFMLSNEKVLQAAITALRGFAKNIGLRENDAVAVFEGELRRLKAEARVTRYVDVIAEKRTRDELRRTMQRVVPRRRAAGGIKKH